MRRRARSSGEPRPAEVERGSGRDPRGPRVDFGYGFYRLADGHGQGQVHAGQFGGYAPLRRLRLGAYGELGARRYALGSDDLLVRAAVELGYQHPDRTGRLMPFVAVEGSAGAVVGKRFSTTQTDRLLGLGVVAGVELRVVGALRVGLTLGYLRMALGDLAHGVWIVRLRVGL